MTILHDLSQGEREIRIEASRFQQHLVTEDSYPIPAPLQGSDRYETLGEDIRAYEMIKGILCAERDVMDAQAA